MRSNKAVVIIKLFEAKYITCTKIFSPFFSRTGTNKLFCPNHRNSPLVEDYRAGDMVCPECGLVVGDR